MFKTKGYEDTKMKKLGVLLIVAFIIWTVLIQFVDVRPLGQNGTDIGFAGFNCWFHELTGVHMNLYIITDWMGLVPIFVCMVLSVMPTLTEQLNRRLSKGYVKRVINVVVICFSAFMVLGRLISGVHWFTDIVGSFFFSAGLFCLYKAAVLLGIKRENN